MKNTAIVKLGSRGDIYNLFPFDPKPDLELAQIMMFCINQTLERDHIFGSWADVYFENGQFFAKITCPDPKAPISRYEKLIPGFVKAGKTAFGLFRKNEDEILDLGLLAFLLPFGLSMARTKSIQLLHYPPDTTLDYMDYLYSKTNRRWQCLLWNNGAQGPQTRLQSIIDAVPLSAPGADSDGIAYFNDTFFPYRKLMLENLLRKERDGDRYTIPAVAYGVPVRQGLCRDYPDQLDKEPEVLNIHTLKMTDGVDITPVLFANHPSEFFYVSNKPHEEKKKMTIMRQDLVAAGWQVEMSKHNQNDPWDTLERVKERWSKDSDVAPIVEEQTMEFSVVHKFWEPNELLRAKAAASGATRRSKPSKTTVASE